jgi:hypothetical protein
MNKEQCLTDCYFVDLRTENGRQVTLKFAFKPSLSDLYAAMKIIAHTDETKKTDMEILMQIVVLINADDFRRQAGAAGDSSSHNFIWVADVKVGRWSINRHDFWNTWIQTWRAPKPVDAPPPATPPEEIPF